MKKYAVVWFSALVILMVGLDSFGADRVRADAGRVVIKRDRGQPEMHERANCEQVGSGLYECELQICRYDGYAKVSICEIQMVAIDG